MCSLKKVIETLTSSLYPNAPEGSTTNGLALSPDEKTLYIANADNNCLAVFDVSAPGNSKSKGFIPTGWYPTCVKAIGKKIFVTNGKGFSSFANPDGPNPFKEREQVIYQAGDTSKIKAVQYIGGLFIGTMSIIDVPGPKQLSAYSQQVYENTPYTKEKETVSQGEKGNPIPLKVGDYLTHKICLLYHKRKPHLRPGIRRYERRKRGHQPCFIRRKNYTQPT